MRNIFLGVKSCWGNTIKVILLCILPFTMISMDAHQVRKWDLDSLYYIAFDQIGNNLQEGKIEVDKYYRASVLLNDSSNLAYALDLKGLDAYMRDKIDSAKMFADQSIRLFRILNDSVGLSTAIYNLSNYHEYLGEYTTALRYLHLAREIDIKLGYKKDNDPFYYNRLSDIVYNQGQLELSLRYLHKAWRAQHESGYSAYYLSPALHLNYAWLYNDLGITELAEYYAKKAYSYTTDDSLLTTRSGALEVLSLSAERRGDMDLALAYAEKALELNKAYGDPYFITYSHLFLMSHYTLVNQLDKAEYYANLVLKSMGPFERSPTFVVDMNDELYKFFKKKGDNAQALKHLERSSEARRIINEVDGIAAMKQFDEEMENRYRELMKTKSRLQEEEINFQNTLLVFALILLIGVLGFLVLLYRSNKQMNAANEQLVLQNNQIESQKQEIQNQAEDLEDRNEKLEKLNSSKDRLFSVLAHDLRQPFNQIIGVIDLLEGEQLEAEDRKSILSSLKSSVQSTSDLVTNVLTWSKAQFAGVTLKPEHLALANTVKRALLHFSIALDKKKIKVVFDIPDQLSIVFDKDHFDSVLRNLFSNAYKFSPANSTIHISAKANIQKRRVYLYIRDEGIGMDQYQKERLVSGNQAVDSINGTFNESGTGIGMVIVRDFLRENESYFDIESKINEGTTFIINMPMGPDVNQRSASNIKAVQDFL